MLRIVATYNLLFNAAVMVENGIGYALDIDKLINTTGDGKLCFRPFDPALTAAVHFICKQYQLFSKPAGLFLQHLEKTLGPR